MIGLIRAMGALFFNVGGAPVETQQEQTPQAKSEPRCTVLVIDDDPTFLGLIRPLLREAGFNVLTSASGPKGLDMLRYAQRDIRAVLLDYNMPRFAGDQTLQYLRTLSPTIKVIGVTGLDEKTLPASYRDEVDLLIHKPFKAADLIAALNRVLDLNVAAS